jgi:hypothetical protein
VQGFAVPQVIWEIVAIYSLIAWAVAGALAVLAAVSSGRDELALFVIASLSWPLSAVIALAMLVTGAVMALRRRSR